MSLLLFWGCLTSHHILTLSDVRSEEERIKNTQRLALILREESEQEKRFFALEVAAKLKTLHPELQQEMGKILLQNRDSDSVQARAAWAVGQMGREKSWEKAKPLFLMLIQALEDESSDEVIYYLLEAMGKLYFPHTHSLEEDLLLIRALESLEARKPQNSGVFYLLRSRVESLEVLLILLKENVEKGKHIKEPARHYQLALNLLWFWDTHQKQLLYDFESQKEKFRDLLNTLSQSLTPKHKEFTLLCLWYLAKLSKDERLADISSSAMLSIQMEDPQLQAFFDLQLSGLLSSSSARNYFRKDFMFHISDESLIQFLSQHHGYQRDFIQSLYGISVSP